MENLRVTFNYGFSSDGKAENSSYGFVYESNRLPPRRQMYYQLVDIKIKSVQERLKDTEPTWPTCSKTDGWLKPGMLQMIRKMINDDINNTKLRKKEDIAERISDVINVIP